MANVTVHFFMKSSSLLVMAGLISATFVAAEPKPELLWPAGAPSETGSLPPEADTTKPSDELIAGKRLIRLGNVAAPTLTIYQPDAANNTGAAVLVCPGGGYIILAMDLEGTEVSDW